MSECLFNFTIFTILLAGSWYFIRNVIEKDVLPQDIRYYRRWMKGTLIAALCANICIFAWQAI